MSPAAARAVVGLLAAAALFGCARKAAVKPPELARPAVIEGVEAANEEDGIALEWRRPTAYADGERMTDLGEFRVEREDGAAGFVVIAVLPVTDRERFRQVRRFRFVDRGVADGRSYAYRVVSSTVDGYASAPSDPVAIVRQLPLPAPATPAAAPKRREE